MFSFYTKNDPQTPSSPPRERGAEMPRTSSKKKKKSSKSKQSFQMIEIPMIEDESESRSTSRREHQLHRTSTDIVEAAQAAQSLELSGDMSVVESRGDGNQIKFKKAKKLRRAASKHYLKHLNETKTSRFKDWKRDHLIHVIVFNKKLELRNEKGLDTEALRELCESVSSESSQSHFDSKSIIFLFFYLS